MSDFTDTAGATHASAVHVISGDGIETESLLTKIQIASDLHIEFLPEDYSTWNEIIEPVAPILCLVGDIGVIAIESERKRLLRFLTYCCESFQNVLFISGNHEYYNSGRGDNIMCMNDIDQVIYSFEGIFKGKFKYLNCEKIIIDGILFLGTTLWSEMVNFDCQCVVEGFLRDYKVIYTENRVGAVVGSSETHELFLKNKQWLIDNIENNNGKLPICVLTHHTPSLIETSNPIYKYDASHPNYYIQHGFSSNLDSLLTNNDLRVWAYGHTHYNNVQYRNRTLLLSNQLGYNVSSHIANYKRSFVVEVYTNRAKVSD